MCMEQEGRQPSMERETERTREAKIIPAPAAAVVSVCVHVTCSCLSVLLSLISPSEGEEKEEDSLARSLVTRQTREDWCRVSRQPLASSLQEAVRKRGNAREGLPFLCLQIRYTCTHMRRQTDMQADIDTRRRTARAVGPERLPLSLSLLSCNSRLVSLTPSPFLSFLSHCPLPSL